MREFIRMDCLLAAALLLSAPAFTAERIEVKQLTDAEYKELQAVRDKAEAATKALRALEEKIKVEKGATPAGYPCSGAQCLAVVVCAVTEAEIRGRFVILETKPTGMCGFIEEYQK